MPFSQKTTDDMYRALYSASQCLSHPYETIVSMLFSQDDIQAGLPWAVLDAQGNHNTIYVSSFGSFESVLAVYEYGNMLENTTQVRKLLHQHQCQHTQ